MPRILPSSFIISNAFRNVLQIINKNYIENYLSHTTLLSIFGYFLWLTPGIRFVLRPNGCVGYTHYIPNVCFVNNKLKYSEEEGNYKKVMHYCNTRYDTISSETMLFQRALALILRLIKSVNSALNLQTLTLFRRQI